MMFLQKSSSHLLDGEVEAPKIPGVLLFGICLIRLVDDSKLDPMRVGRLHTGQVEKFKCNGFEHAVFAAMAVLALLNTRAEIELAPMDAIRLAKVVAGLEVVSFIELEFPHVLAHGVAPGAAASAKVDMVVDLAVVDESAAPFVILAAILFAPGRSFD